MTCKWLISMVSFRPLRIGVVGHPLQIAGFSMAYIHGGLSTSPRILQRLGFQTLLLQDPNHGHPVTPPINKAQCQMG